jgi:glycerophosphoryl diester phosphodiesterase
MHPRRLYAHRGASAERPENTLPAFQRALDLGCDALEMDVHLTRDGQLIVAHDDLATRTTGSPLAWGALDLAEAQRLDAGWGFLAEDGTRPFAGQKIYAPAFAEVLATYQDVRLNVDLKGERAVDVMLALLREHRAEDRVTLASFAASTLIDVRRRKYPGETSLAAREVMALLALPGLAWRQLPWTGTAVQVPTHQGPLRFDRAPFIAKCHSVGLRVDYWVIDDAAEAARLLELGADGIMTNDPAKIASLFR